MVKYLKLKISGINLPVCEGVKVPTCCSPSSQLDPGDPGAPVCVASQDPGALDKNYNQEGVGTLCLFTFQNKNLVFRERAKSHRIILYNKCENILYPNSENISFPDVSYLSLSLSE